MLEFDIAKAFTTAKLRVMTRMTRMTAASLVRGFHRNVVIGDEILIALNSTVGSMTNHIGACSGLKVEAELLNQMLPRIIRVPVRLANIRMRTENASLYQHPHLKLQLFSLHTTEQIRYRSFIL